MSLESDVCYRCKSDEDLHRALSFVEPGFVVEVVRGDGTPGRPDAWYVAAYRPAGQPRPEGHVLVSEGKLP